MPEHRAIDRDNVFHGRAVSLGLKSLGAGTIHDKGEKLAGCDPLDLVTAYQADDLLRQLPDVFKRRFLAPHLLGREYIQARDIGGRSYFPFPLGLEHVLERFGGLVFGRSPRIVRDAGQSRINSQARTPALDHLAGDPSWQQFRPIDLVEKLVFYQGSEVAVRADVDIRR